MRKEMNLSYRSDNLYDAGVPNGDLDNMNETHYIKYSVMCMEQAVEDLSEKHNLAYEDFNIDDKVLQECFGISRSGTYSTAITA